MKHVNVLHAALRGAGVLVCALGLAACATAPEDEEARIAYEETNDPLEPTNRFLFDVNNAVDKAVLKPVAKGYRSVVPSDARNGIRNFFDNAGTPVILINDILQGQGGRAAETLVRFFVNSTAGFFGFFDVAGDYGLERHEEDFGQTLAVWGAGEGPYMMLPVFGPSNVRDTVGLIADSFMNPLSYWASNNDLRIPRYGASLVDGIDKRSRKIETLEDIERDSLDFYATLRSLYRQDRKSEILNGEVTDIPVPEIFDDNTSALPGRRAPAKASPPDAGAAAPAAKKSGAMAAPPTRSATPEAERPAPETQVTNPDLPEHGRRIYPRDSKSRHIGRPGV